MGKFRILIGNIVSKEILEYHDLIINPTNPAMNCGCGVSKVIFNKAGIYKLQK